MKNKVIIGLIIIFVSPMLMKLSLVFNYHTDYSTYLDQCINLEKPELKCNGKCQLAKELQKADLNTPEKPELPSISYLQETFIATPDFLISLPRIEEPNSTLEFKYTFNYSFSWSSCCWRPPAVLQVAV
jgi:hypothetical protein